MSGSGDHAGVLFDNAPGIPGVDQLNKAAGNNADIERNVFQISVEQCGGRCRIAAQAGCFSADHEEFLNTAVAGCRLFSRGRIVAVLHILPRALRRALLCRLCCRDKRREQRAECEQRAASTDLTRFDDLCAFAHTLCCAKHLRCCPGA